MNRVLKKVQEKESKVKFRRIGTKEELCVLGVYDASYHNDEKSVAGEMIMLGNKVNERVSPIY